MAKKMISQDTFQMGPPTLFVAAGEVPDKVNLSNLDWTTVVSTSATDAAEEFMENTGAEDAQVIEYRAVAVYTAVRGGVEITKVDKFE
jgi:hypothetical protein